MVAKILIEGKITNVKRSEKGKQYLIVYTPDDTLLKVFTEMPYAVGDSINIEGRLIYDKGFIAIDDK